MRALTAFGCGVVFGVGLALSQMVNPAKVLAFFDVFGTWDPSLAFVMGGAVAVTMLAFRLILRRDRSLLGSRFSLPARRDIDARLLAGAAIYGVGWGLTGLCVGPAVAALAFSDVRVVYFLAALAVGMAGARRFKLPRSTGA